MKRRDAVKHILAGAALPLIGSCGVDRLLNPSFGFSSSGAATLVGAGDLHATSAALARRQRTAGLVRAVLDQDPAARAFMVGDLTHTGTLNEHLQYYDPTWGVFKDRTLFCMGNHDSEYSGKTGVGYNTYTKAPRYYAENLGSWRIYSLNCSPAAHGGADAAEQTAWLRADLAANPDKQIAAMFHYPMFSSVCAYHTQLTGHPNDMTWKAKVGPWWKLLQAAGCEFALSGHAHRYERLKQMRADGVVSSDGIRQFVVGTAGVMLRDIVPPAHPASEKIVLKHGVLRFELLPDRYEWTFRDEWGAVRDQGSQVTRKV
ncbi:MAG: metallophosphoesterase family protein, partial [Gemmatimonadales bacterium]